MSWARAFILALLTTLFIVTFFCLVEGAAVRDDSKASDAEGAARRVFMPESDASSFFKRRSRRSVRYYESLAEQKVRMEASERRREYNEEQRNEREHYLEEDRDEVNERSMETYEQMREYNYDGRYPRYQYYYYH